MSVEIQLPGGEVEARSGASSLLADLRIEVAAQTDRWVLWSPVALGVGCAIYIAMKWEPGWVLALVPAGLALAAAVAARKWGRNVAISIAAVLMMCVCGGFLAGKVRTEFVRTPVVQVDGPVQITGRVVDVASPGASGGRLIIQPVSIGDLPPDAMPARIRMTVRNGIIGPGAAVRFRGLVNAPPPPASPGAYDFARNAWFDGIGGVGVALTDPVIIDLPPPGWRLQAAMAVNGARWSLAQRIRDKMSAGSGGLGAAMVTGHEAFIAQETEDTLRDAGLAHIVSISGLHMAIVGGFAFFLVRTAIAAWPWLALRVPGKKVAAVAGLV